MSHKIWPEGLEKVVLRDTPNGLIAEAHWWKDKKRKIVPLTFGDLNGKRSLTELENPFEK